MATTESTALTRLSESVYGPFLRFGDCEPASSEGGGANWTGSILYICRDDRTAQSAPTCVLTDRGTSVLEGRLLDTFHDWQFWRFDVSLVLQEAGREIQYRLRLGEELLEAWTFSVPNATQLWRWAAYSCSGFSHDVDEAAWMVNDEHPMVRHLLNRHKRNPYHLNFGGGDQLYNDDVFREPLLEKWLKISERELRHTEPLSAEIQFQVESYYFTHYCEHFANVSLREMVATIPNVMLWDDHDIFDGWGSYPDDMLEAPIFSGIFRVARRFYLLFQHHTTLALVQDGKSDLFGANTNGSPSFSFLKNLGPSMAVMGVDIRSERTKQQILSPESWKLVFENASKLPSSVQHLIVNFTVPIIYPKVPISESAYQLISNMTHVAALNALLVKTNILSSVVKFEFGEPELLDDLVDHWTGAHHATERRWVVEQFQQLVRQRRLRVTFLSGDVHCAAVGRFYSYPKFKNLAEDPYFMPQLITSALINAPPPSVAVCLMHTSDRAGNRINSGTREKMVRFFKERYPREEKVLPRRNFLTVEDYENGSIRAVFHIEDQNDKLQEPEEFEMFIPALAVSKQSSSSPRASKKGNPIQEFFGKCSRHRQ